MSEYRTDLRLPIAVLRRAPFVYVGPDFRSLPLGVLSDIVEHRGRQIQRLNPFTVSRVAGNGEFDDVLFCFTFFYINDDDERVVFLTQPIYLTDSEEPEALDSLLFEAERLAGFVQSRLIEAEVHEAVEGPLAFPTSLSFLSYRLEGSTAPRTDSAALKRHGYREEAEIVSLEQGTRELSRMAGEDEGKDRYVVAPVSPTEYVNARERARGFRIRSHELTRSDSAFEPAKLPFFEHSAYTARRRSRWPLRRGLEEGYLRWTPNIMESFEEIQTPYPLLFPNALEEHAYSAGNVFDWGLSGDDRALFTSLLSEAARSMELRGIERFQLSRVDAEQAFVRNLLGEYGFETIHKIRLLRKELS